MDIFWMHYGLTIALEDMQMFSFTPPQNLKR